MTNTKTFSVVGVSTRNGVAKVRFSMTWTAAVTKTCAVKMFMSTATDADAETKQVAVAYLTANGVSVKATTGAKRDAKGRFCSKV